MKRAFKVSVYYKKTCALAQFERSRISLAVSLNAICITIKAKALIINPLILITNFHIKGI